MTTRQPVLQYSKTRIVHIINSYAMALMFAPPPLKSHMLKSELPR